ncbi:oligosaccharide flippase family protein [Adlercreutzia murintestinalis]|uniref:oligosaccharide flippase family protein n=1 Tax=Adlercreutzia murintestinalis TaxID=2941325 RepID=UPI00203A61AB|nr:oligosaccharide flippase family protein [Adlercreutzia murintestinalis]
MLIYGLGGVLAKIVPFIMVPIVTRLMPGTEYFGMSDMTNTIVSFAQAFSVMGMYDAMFRFFFDDDDIEREKAICSTALFFVLGFSLVVALSMLLFSDPIAKLFFGTTECVSLVIIASISTFIGGSGSIIQAPTRIQNKRITFIVMNLVTSLLSYGISVPLLITGNYVIALPVAAAAAALVSLVVFGLLNRSWFGIKQFRLPYLLPMLKIGIPLMPTFLCYWLFSSADRLMITSILGISEEGIYAIAAMVGQASQLVYTAFAQGWQYFAFSTMHDKDQVSMTSRIYEYLGAISFIVSAWLIVFIAPLFDLLFPSQYLPGITAAPYLFLAPLLLMLFQVLANQLLIIKKTWPSLLMLALGVVMNIALNLVMIPTIGIEGAAIATLAGYLLINAVALIVLTRMKLINVSGRFYVGLLAFTMFFLAWRFLLIGQLAPLLIACAALCVVFALLYRVELKRAVQKIRSLVQRSRANDSC